MTAKKFEPEPGETVESEVGGLLFLFNEKESDLFIGIEDEQSRRQLRDLLFFVYDGAVAPCFCDQLSMTPLEAFTKLSSYSPEEELDFFADTIRCFRCHAIWVAANINKTGILPLGIMHQMGRFLKAYTNCLCKMLMNRPEAIAKCCSCSITKLLSEIDENPVLKDLGDITIRKIETKDAREDLYRQGVQRNDFKLFPSVWVRDADKVPRFF